MGKDQCLRVNNVDLDRPPSSKMEGTRGEKHGSPRPCKLSVRQDLIDLGRVGSIDVTLKQRHHWPREKQRSCTSFSVICQALRTIPSRKTTVHSRWQRAVANGSQNLEQCIPFELPALIPIERMQQNNTDASDGPVPQLRQPPPLIPILQKKSLHHADHTRSPVEVSPEPSLTSWCTSSPQTPPLDLTQNSSTSRLQLHDTGESSSGSEIAQQCDAARKTLDTDITSESESRSCCPLCKQSVTLASLRAHLGQCTKLAILSMSVLYYISFNFCRIIPQDRACTTTRGRKVNVFYKDNRLRHSDIANWMAPAVLGSTFLFL